MPLYTIRFDYAKRPGEEERLQLENILEQFGTALSSFERGQGWRIELIAEEKPNAKELDAALAGVTRKKPKIETLKEKDWIKESEKGLPPIAVGRFFIHGAHHKGPIPLGKKAFLIDAGMAFGTGRHETTSLCLRLLSALKAHGFSPEKILDLGTGTGILAFAAQHLYPEAEIYAVDNDKDSIRIAKENAAINRCDTKKLNIFTSDGYHAARVKKAAPFDLVIANILANPLIEMADDLKAHLAIRGFALLSGLMNDQEKAVLQAHQGMKLREAKRRRKWSALLLQKVQK